MGINLFNALSMNFFACLFIDAVAVCLLVGLIYFPRYRKADFVFSGVLFNLVIFILTYLLNGIELSLGAAFGLFAVFSMLRYRTEGISTKEMTYLFVLIAMGLISAMSKTAYAGLIMLHGIILLVIFLLESSFLLKKEIRKTILYENIDLIKPEARTELIADLRNKTGLNIHRVEIESYDFLKDAALVTVFFYENKK